MIYNNDIQLVETNPQFKKKSDRTKKIDTIILPFHKFLCFKCIDLIPTFKIKKLLVFLL